MEYSINLWHCDSVLEKSKTFQANTHFIVYPQKTWLQLKEVINISFIKHKQIWTSEKKDFIWIKYCSKRKTILQQEEREHDNGKNTMRSGISHCRQRRTSLLQRRVNKVTGKGSEEIRRVNAGDDRTIVTESFSLP